MNNIHENQQYQAIKNYTEEKLVDIDNLWRIFLVIHKKLLYLRVKFCGLRGKFIFMRGHFAGWFYSTAKDVMLLDRASIQQWLIFTEKW